MQLTTRQKVLELLRKEFDKGADIRARGMKPDADVRVLGLELSMHLACHELITKWLSEHTEAKAA